MKLAIKTAVAIVIAGIALWSTATLVEAATIRFNPSPITVGKGQLRAEAVLSMHAIRDMIDF